MKWYAIYTKHKNEFKAREFFDKLGINSYVPYQSEAIKSNNKIRYTKKVIISGLLFFNIDELDFDLINTNPYVKSLVRSFGKPVEISDEEIKAMKTYITSKTSINEVFEVGKSVKIETGVLIGHTAEIITINGDALWVSLPSLQTKICISLKNNRVKAA